MCVCVYLSARSDSILFCGRSTCLRYPHPQVYCSKVQKCDKHSITHSFTSLGASIHYLLLIHSQSHRWDTLWTMTGPLFCLIHAQLTSVCPINILHHSEWILLNLEFFRIRTVSTVPAGNVPYESEPRSWHMPLPLNMLACFQSIIREKKWKYTNPSTQVIPVMLCAICILKPTRRVSQLSRCLSPCQTFPSQPCIPQQLTGEEFDEQHQSSPCHSSTQPHLDVGPLSSR